MNSIIPIQSKPAKSMGSVSSYALRVIGKEHPVMVWFHEASAAQKSKPSDCYEVVKVTVEVVK